MSYVNGPDIKEIILNALKEDIGTRDLTTGTIIPGGKIIEAALIAKEDCVICGLPVASSVFRLHNKKIKFKTRVSDGKAVKRGTLLARVSGDARAILTAERVALNFLSHLSGIATKTRRFVRKVRPHKTRILDTRKTSPGLRLLEKYAVRIGGGFNHRLNLEEMVLIKDNHLKVIGGIHKLAALKNRYKTEIEVKTLKEFKAALRLRPDVIMLDNMSLRDMQRAVQIRNGLSSSPVPRFAPRLEASGGITLGNVKRAASTGVDMISIGELTHSPDSIDISLEVL